MSLLYRLCSIRCFAGVEQGSYNEQFVLIDLLLNLIFYFTCVFKAPNWSKIEKLPLADSFLQEPLWLQYKFMILVSGEKT